MKRRTALLALLAVSTLTPAAAARGFDEFEAGNGARPSWNNTYLLALATQASGQGANRGARFGELGLREVARINSGGRRRNTDTQVSILVNRSVVVVAFPGSASFKDWFNDFQIRKKRNPWGQRMALHNGFYRASESVYARVKASLRRHLVSGRRLWLAGHSLGGAVATLTALRLKLDGITITGLYTYGAPRAGDKKFAALYSRLGLGKRTHRVVNHRDRVARLPVIARRWKHVGRWHYMDKQRMHFNRGGDPVRRRKRRFGDHPMDQYLRAMRRLMPGTIRRPIGF